MNTLSKTSDKKKKKCTIWESSDRQPKKGDFVLDKCTYRKVKADIDNFTNLEKWIEELDSKIGRDEEDIANLNTAKCINESISLSLRRWVAKDKQNAIWEYVTNENATWVSVSLKYNFSVETLKVEFRKFCYGVAHNLGYPMKDDNAFKTVVGKKGKK